MTQTISQKRRKLLIASASAPLIATLSSGAALANASAVQCIDDVTSAPGAQFSENADSVVRMAVPFYPDDEIYELETGFFDSSGSPFYDDPGQQDGVAYVLRMYTPNSDNSCVTSAGVWPQLQLGSSNTPLNGTCLTSFIISDTCDTLL